MNKQLMVMVICMAFTPRASQTQTAEDARSKLVIGNACGEQSSDNTTCWTADRRRAEFRHAVQRRKDDGSVEWMDEVASVFIVRCDLGQSFTLKMKAEEYSVAEYPPKRLTSEEIAARGTPVAPQPTLRIEIATVDTGEREKMFGHVARHVITTTKQIRLEGSHTQAQETVRDGWYIDVDRRISCDPKGHAGRGGAFVACGAVVGCTERTVE